MASQININPQQVPSSVAQDKSKSLRSLDEKKSSVVTVRVTRKWEELDFMSTNDVTIVDMVIVDEQGDELHAINPKIFIWKFDKHIREGGLYTIEKLHLTNAKPKFRPAHSEKRGYFWRNTSLSALDAYSGNHPFDNNVEMGASCRAKSTRKTCRLRWLDYEVDLIGRMRALASWQHPADPIGETPKSEDKGQT
ncbi:hypothetical protein C5167_008812 [Papaver somniferum]|uniref:Replication protein A 70 kDa DNA-binding subunit B/D first OB fold domain-containing protein n=1 Tax=Papaver somniferum TaxID=3469 RepID=A0A4Y7JYL0_PAPSO|nr:hypothetical protein C5167_008812 [Papaver somniferum]